METVIRLAGVSKTYLQSDSWAVPGSRRKVLDEIDLEIRSGQILGIIGRSGTGKSTLGRIAALMEAPDSGRVFLEGREVETLRLAPRQRSRVQYVFQNPGLSFNPRMTVWRQLCEAPLYHQMGPAPVIEERVRRLVSSLALSPDGLETKYAHEFSGGQQQRLALARALAVEPRLLVCDEITASLDFASSAELLKLLRLAASATQAAVLFISHDLDAVREIASEVLRLSGGVLSPLPGS